MDAAKQRRPDNPWVTGGLWVVVGLVLYVVAALVLSGAAQTRAATPAPKPSLAVPFGPDRVPLENIQLHKAGFDYECYECHYDRVRDRTPRTFVGEHSVLEFDHGRNDMCFNCHHETELTSFVGRDGEVLPSTEHVKLCASCHGPKYRDWLGGAHGRRSGHWDRKAGERRRTDCIVCHDPHRPAFKPIQPLPPPGVAVGVVHPPHPAHGVVRELLGEIPEPEKPALRGPALDPEDE